jgi:hypothetical protein
MELPIVEHAPDRGVLVIPQSVRRAHCEVKFVDQDGLGHAASFPGELADSADREAVLAR